MEAFKELLIPSNACLLVAMAGVVAWCRPGWRRAARWMLCVSLGTLALLSSGLTASLLLGPLEHATLPAEQRPDDPPAAAIVILGGYAEIRPDRPLSGAANGAALMRIVEAIHLRKRCGACPLVVSGTKTTAAAMARVLASLGVPPGDIVVDGNSPHTMASARNLASRLGGAPFYLVTSAGHMPRALIAFGRMGLQPLPAPTDFRDPGRSLSRTWPSVRSLRLSDIALHEYLGIAWYRMSSPTR